MGAPAGAEVARTRNLHAVPSSNGSSDLSTDVPSWQVFTTAAGPLVAFIPGLFPAGCWCTLNVTVVDGHSTTAKGPLRSFERMLVTCYLGTVAVRSVSLFCR